MARLPEYLRILVELADQKLRTVSSGQLAGLAGVNAAKVRKDLSHLGTYGTRGVGYDVDFLLFQVRQALGLTRDWPTVVVGAGNLGRALANYAGFSERGFPVVGVLDADPAKVGTLVGPFRVRPLGDLAELVAGHDNLIGIIATPPAAAQEVADLLVAERRHRHPELRPRLRRGARGRGGAQGGPRPRAADPLLLPAPAGGPPAALACLALQRCVNEAEGHCNSSPAGTPIWYRLRPGVVLSVGSPPRSSAIAPVTSIPRPHSGDH